MGVGNSACFLDKQAEGEIQQVWDFVKARLFSEQKSKKQKLTA